MDEAGTSCRIVFMGGGSTQFAPALMADFVRAKELDPSQVVLVDRDPDKLERVYRLGLRLIEAAGSGCTLECTTDRREALAGADFVVVSVEVDRLAAWELDRRIPAALGVPQALGENGGPGGLAHALRQIPHVVEICQDVEAMCPGALVINLANPMSRILQAVRDATGVTIVGLCHEIQGGNQYLAHVLDMPPERIEVVAAGLNHFSWYLTIRDRATGRDLYPLVRERVPARLKNDRLLVADLLRVTGHLCVTNDSHAGEYLAGGHLWHTDWAPDAEPEDFLGGYLAQLDAIEARMGDILSGKRPPEELLEQHSGEVVDALIGAVRTKRDRAFDALNLPNRGLVPNLPDGCMVEVPGRVAGGRVEGRAVGELPPVLAGWCHLQAIIHALTARAALEGDRRAALEALLLDPVVPDHHTAERCLEALLQAHRPHLPRFFR